MTDTSHPLDLLAELAVGILPDDERAHVEAHVQECGPCHAELQLLTKVTAILPLAAPEDDVSHTVRDGLMARIAAENRSPAPVLFPPAGYRRFGFAAAAAALAVLAAIGGFAVGRSTGGGPNEAEVARYAELAQSAVTGTLRSSTGTGGSARATFVRAPGAREGYLSVEDLPALPDGKAYQAWFTRDGAAFEPSAVFGAGERNLWLAAGSDLANYVAMGFTIEDRDGAAAPTQAPFLVVGLQ